MATHQGKFRPPPQRVSITDGQVQFQFDHPADMADFLRTHPEVAERIQHFSWTTQEISGGH